MDRRDNFRLVHLDLKGAPPKYSYYEQLIPFLSKQGANGLLIEYEDTFPYWGDLQELKSQEAYSLEEVNNLLKLAKDHNMTVIPLVQTFGHFEFVLKHDKFRHLREVPNYPMALCPSLDEAFSTVCAMIDQVMQVHNAVTFFHIGADEVFHMNICERCKSRRLDPRAIYVDHVTKICHHVTQKYPGVKPVMWDDIFRSWSVDTLKKSGLGDVAEPMVWYYGREYCLDEDLWSKYGSVFESCWVATAFKGATGATMFVTDVGFHVDNHLAWTRKMKEEASKVNNFRGYAITGWQRYDHYAVLCELLPAAIPSLCLSLRILNEGAFTVDVHRSVSSDLGFAQLIPCNPFSNTLSPQLCSFPGKEVYLGVLSLLRLNADYDRFLKDERLNGWMTPYHLKHNYANPVHLEYIISIGSEVTTNMTLLQTRMRKALSDIFHEPTVDEWMELYVNPKVRQLTQIMENGQKQIQIGGRIKDNQVTKPGTESEMSIP